MPATSEAEREKLTVVFVDDYSNVPPKRYRRPLVRRTVRKALDLLDVEAEETEGIKIPYPTWPCRIRRNGEVREVQRNSCVVLQKGDIFIIDP